MNIFFILWYISIIWFDFFYHWRAFSFFHMHILILRGTFQPQPSPLFQKTEAPTPPLPNSHLTPNFSAVYSQEKNMHIAIFCWIQKFWNLEFNQAWINLGTAGSGEGWGRGGVYLGLKNLLSLILHTFDYKKVIHLPYRWCDVTAILLLAKE